MSQSKLNPKRGRRMRSQIVRRAVVPATTSKGTFRNRFGEAVQHAPLPSIEGNVK